MAKKRKRFTLVGIQPLTSAFHMGVEMEKMPRINSMGELRRWLADNKIDIAGWGTDGTKTVDNLWNELANGEAQLLDAPPLRVVEVVEIFIQNGNRVLKELEQEFGSGERRSRDRLPSEKMKPDERCLTAALRCLAEELDVDEHNVTFTETDEPVKALIDSPSYPGLKTQYTFYRVVARVNGLPDTDFWRDNAAFRRGDPIKRHHWTWVAENIQ